VPAKIVIVDDHEIVREGIRTLIARSRPEWNIVGEASSGAEAIEICKTLTPDVLVLDITMPGMSGLEAALKIAESELGCRVLMFTMHESERLAAEVRQAGAQGLVLKSQAARDLIRAIECLLAGGTFFGREPDPEKNIPTSLPPSGSATDQSIRDCRGHTPANRFVARIRSCPIRSILLWSYRQTPARGIHRTVSRWTTR
jgi:DNA-binding NarL/FixJ family response regulator